MTASQSAEFDPSAIEVALRKRLDDYLRSTFETHTQPVGSEAWRKGLVGYLMRGPGSLTDVLSSVTPPAEGAE